MFVKLLTKETLVSLNKIKIMKHIFFVVIIFMSTVIYTFAQKQLNECLITYKISMKGGDPQAEGMFSNAKMTQYIKGDRSCVNMDLGMMSQIMIVNGKNKNGNLLLDMMGKKFNVMMTEKEMQSQREREGKYEIKKTTETKEVCGYKCIKANITYKAEEGDETGVVYYTKDLSIRFKEFNASKINELEGFPLEWEGETNGMKIHYLVTKIEEKNVDDKVFEIPSDYKTMTWSEFAKSMGGMNGE